MSSWRNWRCIGAWRPCPSTGEGGALLAASGRRALESLAPAEAAKLFADALELPGPRTAGAV